MSKVRVVIAGVVCAMALTAPIVLICVVMWGMANLPSRPEESKVLESSGVIVMNGDVVTDVYTLGNFDTAGFRLNGDLVATIAQYPSCDDKTACEPEFWLIAIVDSDLAKIVDLSE